MGEPMGIGIACQQKGLEKNMHVVHIAGVPPNHGRKNFPSRSCTEKSRNAPRKMLAQ